MFCVELAWLEKNHCATENQTNAEWGLTGGESKHRMVCLHFEITKKQLPDICPDWDGCSALNCNVTLGT